MSRAVAWLAAANQELSRVLHRRSHYRAAFGSVSGEAVLADLMRFCGVRRTSVTFSPATGAIDPIAMAIREGRREVALRILKHLNLDEEKLQKLQENDDE